jgi:hypothetical protein
MISGGKTPMTPELLAKLKAFNGALYDRPLEPDDHCYIPYLKEMKELGDPIFELFTKISWSEAASVNLLSGQRGSGKSTELRRLRNLLVNEGCVVFLCDMRDYMNLTTPVEITDFFISIMGGLSEAFEEKYGKIPARPGYWERISNFLQSEVTINEISLDAGEGIKAGIKASLKEDPTFRQQLQKNLRGHVARLTQQAHEFATDVVEEVRNKTGDKDKKVVFLIDSVEQIRGVGSEAESVYKSVENLFSAHAEKLHLPLLHVVYTIPPYLTPLAPGLGRHLGGGMISYLPSVHVFRQDGTHDPSGLSVMKKVISCRYGKWKDIFSEEQIERMAIATGGDFRDFFRLITGSLVKAVNLPTLPVSDDIIEEAENHLRRDMLPIAEEDMKWLREIADSKDARLRTIAELPRLARFFDTSLVLNYRNGDYWYDIHPLLKKIVCDERPE